MSQVQLPTDPNKLQQLKLMVVEITKAMARIDQEREAIKDVVDQASQEFGLKKPMIKKIASTMYQHKFETLQQENEQFEYVYEAISGQKSSE